MNWTDLAIYVAIGLFLTVALPLLYVIIDDWRKGL